MYIPALFALFTDRTPMAGNAEQSNGRLYAQPPFVPLKSACAGSGNREPAVVVDVKGLNGRVFDDRIIKNAKVSGSDMWLMTRIRDLDDVLDGFMGNAEKLLVPYHTLKNANILKDVIELSDCCIPVVFSNNGAAKCFRRTAELGEIIKETASIGFPTTIVFDADNSISLDVWSHICDRHPGAVPFLGPGRDADVVKAIGFEDVIVASEV
ncbi:MAG: hypothetical protein LBS92_01865 [Candidatus Methanoplasma sp.]|jgi:hypothetical protein|nr:hypothetical protein [Candidatus Methanoplasma sp.]